MTGSWSELYPLLTKATGETLYMVLFSTAIAVLFGIPLGVLLVIAAPSGIWPQRGLYRLLSAVINTLRSIPFIILLLILIPLTQLLVGTFIGPTASIIPLAVAAIPFVARLTETSLLEVDKGVIEAAMAAGATQWQIIWKVLLPEARAGLLAGVTITIINLVGYSAMAGAVGGGGLGDLAIRYGFHRHRMDVLWATVILLLAFVQLVQSVGDKVVHHFSTK